MTSSDINTEERIVKTVCSSCYCGCGVLAHVRGGRVVRIQPDPDHPHNKGQLCIRGHSGIELLYHPDRLNYPLKQVGKRGQGKWQRISWDEALGTIAEKLSEIKERYGPESICVATGSGLYANMGIIGYFAYLLGTPNVSGSGNICFVPAAIATQATIGYPIALFANEIISEDALDSNCILLWGANPRYSFPYPIGEGIFAAKERGAKLIVVDPRPTDYANIADLWLQIRPATDDALALAMTNVMINEGLYDEEFIAEWTYGFDKLKEHIGPYTPERVSKITWIPERDIIAAARMFAEIRPSCICQRVAIDQSLNSVQASRAILIMRALCGDDFDIRGGTLLPAEKNIMGEFPHWMQVSKLPKEVKEKRIGAKELPILSGPDADFAYVHPTLFAKAIVSGQPYRIRALITSAHNQMVSDMDTRTVEEGLKNVEFSVAMDLFMTPTTELYDIVLPATCWLENDGIRGHPGYPYLTPILHKATDPLFERWSDIRFFIELAKRMGLDIPWKSSAEYTDFRLKAANITFKDLEGINFITKPKEYERHKRGTFEFKTPTKKIELYSSLMEKYGFDPLPSHKPPPEPTPDFPLILIGGRRRLEYVHSGGRQIESLRKLAPDPVVEINPNTAEQHGISDGDWVSVETIYFGEKRSARFKAKLIQKFHPSIVAVDPQWWFPERRDPEHGCYESNISTVMTGDVYDPISGSTNLKSIPCRISKAQKSDP
jgi:anaerobic selenocysteine-containing dehydrogenase